MANPGKITLSTGDETALALHRQGLGMLGGIFGERKNAPTNIAGAATFLLLIVLGALLFLPVPADLDRKQALQTFGGFFLAALGYLFGSLSGAASKGD